MSGIREWREAKGWTQTALGHAVGLRSKGQVSRLEAGVGITTDLAIAIDRLTAGAVTVRELRPDLHDVRVLQSESAASA